MEDYSGETTGLNTIDKDIQCTLFSSDPKEGPAGRTALCLRKIGPRPEVVFISQILVIYIVIGVSLFNLTTGNGDGNEGKLWIVLLSSCLGYLLPNPKVDIGLPIPQP